MIYKKIASGSTGNAIVYHDKVMVDCGVNHKTIKPYAKELKYILLTHIHKDHFKEKTIIKIAHEHPKIIWFTPIWLEEKMRAIGVDNIYVVEMNKVYQVNGYLISPFFLYHDVQNCGWRIVDKETDFKIFHATDTATLEGISAKAYDLYAIEYNHNVEEHLKTIEEKQANGEYAYEVRAMNNHLSFEQAERFINENKKEGSEVLKLHMSSRYVGETK